MSIINKISALGRPLDLSYPTNRILVIVVLLAMAATLLFRLISGVPFWEAMFSTAAISLAVFLTWSLGREFDPPNDWSAFVALPFSFILALTAGNPAFMALVYILLFSRVLNGITGFRARVTDYLLLLAIAAQLFYNGLAVSLPVLVFVSALDATLEPKNRHGFLFALLSVVVMISMLLIFPDTVPSFVGINITALVTAFSLIAALLLLVTKNSLLRVIKDDVQLAALNPMRLKLALLISGGFILAELLLAGNKALLSFYPALFAFGGTAIYGLARSIFVKSSGDMIED
jgi:hypothetical protein